MTTLHTRRLIGGLAACSLVALASAAAAAQEAGPAAELLHHIDLSAFGESAEFFRAHVKFGDLDNDGQPRDFIRYVNSNRMQAFAWDGGDTVSLLWDYTAPIDLPNPVERWFFQYAIWDIDQDGEMEIIGPFATERGFVELRVLDAATGAIEAAQLLPIANPIRDHSSRGLALRTLVANTRGLETPQDIVLVEERASNGDIWVLDQDLATLWDTTRDQADKKRITASNAFAHDVDGDGRDELVGSWLLDDDGSRGIRLTPEHWAEEDWYYDHVRRAVVHDFLPDREGLQVLYSHAYNEATMVDLATGDELWRRDTEAQSPGIRAVGQFLPESPGLEFVFQEPGGDVAMIAGMDGEVLYTFDQGLRHALTIDWDGDRTADELLSCRNAVLVDPDTGTMTALSALYEARAIDLPADGTRLYSTALDLIGDAREEVVVFDGNELLVFGAGGEGPADLVSPWTDMRYRLAQANAVTDFFCDRTPWFDWREIGSAAAEATQ